MSALPPKADIVERDRHVRFVPKADSCSAAILSLFDHLAGLRKQHRRHGEAERFGGLQIDYDLVLCHRLNGKIGWLLAFENAIGVIGRSSGLLDRINSMAHQTAFDDHIGERIDRGQPELGRKRDDPAPASIAAAFGVNNKPLFGDRAKPRMASSIAGASRRLSTGLTSTLSNRASA